MILCKKCGYSKDCFMDDIDNSICPECKDSWLTEKFLDEKRYYWIIGYYGNTHIKFYSDEQAKRYETRAGWKIFPV